MPEIKTRIGYSIELREKGINNYIESISTNLSDQPYSWSTLQLAN
jgi:hypothetical protein